MLFLQVYGVTWNAFEHDPARQSFVTWGKKHCKAWTRQPAGSRGTGSAWTATQLSFGRYDVQNVHSAAFLPVGHALAVGLAHGEIVVFEGTRAVRSIKAHACGPQFIAPDGSLTHSGVRGMSLQKENTVLLTSGAGALATPSYLQLSLQPSCGGCNFCTQWPSTMQQRRNHLQCCRRGWGHPPMGRC